MISMLIAHLNQASGDWSGGPSIELMLEVGLRLTVNLPR
jgi:hypothetical protein